MDDLDQRIDALYAGPPGEFTAGRDALAKDLRAAGEKEEADRVRKLRRPTKIAAELNRLARGEPEAMAAAIEAEDALEEAQRGVLEGTGSADDLRAAERREAEAVAALSPDPAVRAALRLAARSPDAREDLRRGRISQDPEPDPGAALFGMGPVALPPRPAGAPRSAPAPASPPKDELAAVRAKRERASARQAAQTDARGAVREERAAQEKLTRARRRASQAGAEARRAAEALERVTRELAEAQARLSAREEEARAAAEAEAVAEAAATEAAARREAADRAATQADEGDPSA